jgi:two-component system, LytTR family, response regulator
MDWLRMLRVVVATGESASMQALVQMIRDNGGVDIVALTRSVSQARSFLATHEADVLLADMDVPGGGAFVLASAIPPGRRPLLIFTAPDDSRALDAFRFQPLDFIVAPPDATRVKETIKRAASQAIARRFDEGEKGISELLKRAHDALPAPLRLMVKTAGRISFMKADDIDWVEAERDYVRIHNAGRKVLLRQKISRLEQQLPSSRFLRIHRSTIVNIERIKELQPLSFGEYSAILYDGTRLTISRSFRERVFERLQTAA